MIFIETELKGAYIIDVEKIVDDRGFFGRIWCQEEFMACGLKSHFVQTNVGFSNRRGTIRGMHFQKTPWEEAKLVRCTRGAIYDVIIDLRADSLTHGKWVGVELTQDSHRMLYVPEGFAHGYQTLTDNCEMYYQTTQSYAPQFAFGTRYNDPFFEIVWPLPVAVVSEKDESWPDYSL